MNKLVENIDPVLWKQLVGIAKLKDLKVGELLNSIMLVFIEKQKIRTALKNEDPETNRS